MFQRTDVFVDRILLFDVGNVLVKSDRVLTFKELERLGVTAENAANIYDNEDFKAFCKGDLSAEEFLELASEKHLKKQVSLNDLKKAHVKHLTGLVPGAKELLDELKRRGVRLGFFTNTNEWQNDYVDEVLNPNAYSKIVFKSNELRCRKPDSVCFEKIISLLHLKPEKIWFVDNKETNIIAAREAGLNAIKFNYSDDDEELEKSMRELRNELKKEGFL